MIHDLSGQYITGFLSLIYGIYLAITKIYKGKIWKYETYLFFLCMVFIVFDYILTMILSCTNFDKLYVTIFLPNQSSIEVTLIGVISIFWIVIFYYNWNVIDYFKESVPIKTRRIRQKFSALSMYMLLLVHVYWYWILITNFSIR